MGNLIGYYIIFFIYNNLFFYGNFITNDSAIFF